MTRFLIAICLLILSNEVFADEFEPCDSEELQAAFDEKKQIEYEVSDDLVSVVVTVPVELPKVRIGGLFLILEENETRILQAPLVRFSDTPNKTWTSVTLAKETANGYSIAASYYSRQPQIDGCWYELRVSIESISSE
jgi:hypothetical protein